MRDFSQLEFLLWGGATLAQVILFVKIASHSYLRKYRAFSLVLICNVLFSLALFATSFLESSRFAYSQTYLAKAYLVPITYFLWIQELFQVVLQPYGAFQKAAKTTLRVLLAVLFVSGACWYLYLSANPPNGPVDLMSALRYQQTCAFGFALYLLFFLCFVSFMPVPMTANQLLHSFCTGGYFLVVGATALMAESFGYKELRGQASLLQMGAPLLLYLAWIVRWQPQGELGLIVAAGPLNVEGSQELLERMHALDRRLERSGPRLLR
jgi:hypothetical protein